MKINRQQKQRVLKPSTKQNSNRSQSGVRKPTNSNRGRYTKANETFSAAGTISRLQNCSRSVKINEVPSNVIGRVTVQIPISTRKLKLQFFPLDQRIRTGLEKDGYNPHLELTLSAKKKIPAVILHLHNKWGNSSVALGDPTLFPFNNIPEDLASYRSWTLNDAEITIGDVHAALGYPTIFRLRYAWFPAQPNYVAPISSIPTIHGQLVVDELKPGKLGEQSNFTRMEHAAEGYPCKMVALLEDNLVDKQPNATVMDQTVEIVEQMNATGMEHAAEGNPCKMVVPMWTDFVDDQPNAAELEHAAEGNTCNLVLPIESTLVDKQPKVAEMEHAAEVNPCNMMVPMEDNLVNEQPNSTGIDHVSEDTPCNMKENKDDNAISWISAMLDNSQSNISITALPSDASLFGKFSLLDTLSNMSMGALRSEASLPGKFSSLPDCQSNISIGALLREASLTGKFSSLPDSRSNLSIGALLAEASLPGKSGLPDAKSSNSRSEFQPNHLVADSLDAVINEYQFTQQAKDVTSGVSILDAENTCHAFAFKKNSSFRSEFQGSCKSFSTLLTPQNDGLKSHCSQIEGKNNDDQKPKTDELPGTRGIFNEENSLGFSAIKWNDSMGPWDIGVHSQQLLLKTDSISMSEFVW